MFVVTFYSYKGGVGRTSALVNVAVRLAKRGKRVFILDFDLEAPGVESYPLFEDKEPHNGIVEYIESFMQSAEVPPVNEYVVEATCRATPGKIFVMRAGKKDQSYQTALSRLDWKVFYRQKKGYLFIENLKGAIRDHFNPDYVLVDSRTGLTDVSGICTIQLPNLVVLLFSLNEQNVDGVAQMHRSIKNNKINRAISTLLVASPVPDMPEWVAVRTERFERARRAIGDTVDLVLPYDPFLAFQESILGGHHGDQEEKTYLGSAYDALADKIIWANTEDVLTLLRKATELRNDGDYELAELNYREVVEKRPESAEAWLEFGKFAKLRGNIKDACEYLEKALALRPGDLEALAQLSTTYLRRDRARAQRYFRQFLEAERDTERIENISMTIRDSGDPDLALEGFQRMVELEEEPNHYANLGETHMRQRHYRQAFDAYRRVVELEPNDLAGIYNAGYALSRVGDPRSVDYFTKAIEMWEQTDKSGYDPVMLANKYEAMSHAYIGVGTVDKAIDALEKAIQLARRLGRVRIFSSVRYELIPQQRFVAEVEQLLESARQRVLQGGSADGRPN